MIGGVVGGPVGRRRNRGNEAPADAGGAESVDMADGAGRRFGRKADPVAFAQIVDIRGRVEQAMMSYNFESMLWEWGYLGLYDLLSAANGVLARPEARARASASQASP